MRRVLVPSWMFLVLCSSVLACSSAGGRGSDDAPGADAGGDASGDGEGDAAPESGGPDLGPILHPVPLRVGVASRPLPAPVGVSLAGFYVPGDNEGSPFAKSLLASHGTYMLPDVRAVAVEGGTGRLVLVRADLIGVFSRTREAVLSRLRERTGADLSDSLVIGATHTHSGPARLYQGAMDWMVDGLMPELHDRLVDAIAGVVIDALSDLEPARLGFTVTSDPTLHADRRCQNPPLDAPDLAIVRFDRADGSMKALVLNYAVHGTVLHPTLHILSPDVIGGIERKVAEAFDHPVHVMLFNGWAGDSSPADDPPLPGFGLPSQATPEAIQRAKDGIERIGSRAAAAVAAVVDGIEMTGEADVDSLTLWAPIGRDVMGYGPDEFPFPEGAMCGLGGEGHCWEDPGNPLPNLDHECIALPADPPLPRATPLTVGRVGSLAFATFPGEAVTALGLGVQADVREATGAKTVLFLGYSQDFLFYSMPEADWWQGGYEASMSLWGPKQGDWLRARIAEVAGRLADRGAPLSFEPPDPLPALLPAFEPRAAARSLDAGTIVRDVAGPYGAGSVVTFAVAGGDPWLGTPRVVVEREDAGGEFAPLLRRDGSPVSTDGYEVDLTLDREPTWASAPDGALRRFVWTATMQVTRAVPPSAPLAPGRYRLWFEGDAADAAGAVSRLSVRSAPFIVK